MHILYEDVIAGDEEFFTAAVGGRLGRGVRLDGYSCALRSRLLCLVGDGVGG